MTRGYRLAGDNALAALTQTIRSRMRADESRHRIVGTDDYASPSAPPGLARTLPAGSHPGGEAPAPLERDIQAAILALLRVHPRVAWAQRMNVGMAEYAGADGSIRRVRFAFPGCPDILGQLKDGRLLAIEVKRATGRVTEDQVAFLSRAARHNACAFVARSVDDVTRMLA